MSLWSESDIASRCPRNDVRLDGDEVVPDADDGDAGHFSRTFIILSIRAPRTKDSHECRDLENAQRRGGP